MNHVGEWITEIKRMFFKWISSKIRSQLKSNQYSSLFSEGKKDMYLLMSRDTSHD
jgi:hypothetical protein